MDKTGRPGKKGKKRLFGLSLLLSILVLLLEATLALVVSIVYGVTQESPDAGVGGSAMFIFLLPVLAVFATAVAAMLSVGLVFPTAWLSDVLGRRFGGREVWWWVPVVAGAVSLLLVGAVVALAGGAGAGAVALGWFLTTAALTVPALLWRSHRERVFGPVTLWGVAAIVLTAVLGGVGLATGVLKEYRPPAATSADFVGRWSDGHGGTLTFGAGGRVTADAVDDDLGGWGPGDGEDDGDICTGQGTWTYEPGEGRWSQVVDVRVDSCTYGTWNVGGTESRLTLYQFIGDPDSWDLYELRKTSEQP
ncbi:MULTISPECIES: hypothetical protein [Streptomyces]|uniref:Integral membrane protein n=1 Tax=Streptomyces durocortorensis TaxID=2811104 RepID=A0ABS2I0D9_9ACTN|nr:hypothetical protein [Streptomyces durocortorensis]MBM7055523.1 hypothetical protein [Streptomyces durocortorensis]